MRQVHRFILLSYALFFILQPCHAETNAPYFSVPGYKYGAGEKTNGGSALQTEELDLPPLFDSVASENCNPIEFDNIPPYSSAVIALTGKFYFIRRQAPWIPPDPGEKGKLSIAGIDSDGDCLRDDLERLVASLAPLPGEKRLRKYLYQYSILQTKFLISQKSGFTEYHAKEFSREMYVAGECVDRILKNRSKTDYLLQKLFSATHNTYARSVSYIENSKLLGGWSTREKSEVSCP